MSTSPSDWQVALSQQIGAALRGARTASGMSVLGVAAATAGLGYPLHRVTISKIESGSRSITVADVLALSAAIGTVPVRMILPAGAAKVEVLPGVNVTGAGATGWFTGTSGDTPATAMLLDLVSESNDVEQQLEVQRRNLFQVKSGIEKLALPDAFKEHQRARLEHLRALIESLERQRDSILNLLKPDQPAQMM